MKQSFVLASLSLLLALACLDRVELGPSALDPGDGGTGAPPEPACGGRDQTCCSQGPRACAEGLRCDLSSGACVTEEARLCTSVTQCHEGQSCCPSGLLGSCVTLAGGSSDCPSPDLVVVTTQDTLAFTREQRRFSPETSVADACAIEKGCVAGPGLRQLLRFSIRVENQGDADLILGIPGATPAFQTASCDGQPYLPNYLHYQLFDIDGEPVPGAEGHAQARCQALPDSVSARFNCDFWGVWRGFSESFFPTVSVDPANPAAVDCQWVDVTEVPPGNYSLRVTVNPDGLLPEPGNGNQRDFALTLPALDAPTSDCPPNQGTSLEPSGGDSLLGSGVQRECGWSIVAATRSTSCTPGTRVNLGCATCDVASDPMLRVCEGAGPCTAGGTLATGDDTVILYDDSGITGEELSDTDCALRAVADPEYFCQPVSPCPRLQFTCPVSGAYTALEASALANATATCGATALVDSDANGPL